MSFGSPNEYRRSLLVDLQGEEKKRDEEQGRGGEEKKRDDAVPNPLERGIQIIETSVVIYLIRNLVATIVNALAFVKGSESAAEAREYAEFIYNALEILLYLCTILLAFYYGCCGGKKQISAAIRRREEYMIECVMSKQLVRKQVVILTALRDNLERLSEQQQRRLIEETSNTMRRRDTPPTIDEYTPYISRSMADRPRDILQAAECVYKSPEVQRLIQEDDTIKEDADTLRTLISDIAERIVNSPDLQSRLEGLGEYLSSTPPSGEPCDTTSNVVCRFLTPPLQQELVDGGFITPEADRNVSIDTS